jgi:hypothetical protein
VLRLSPDLHRRTLFAPTTWREDNAQDLDLGSMAPVVVGDRIVIAGKRGEVYLLDDSLGGVGGQLAQLSGCAGYGGAAVVGTDVVMPCDGGLRLLHTGRSSLRWGWRSALTGSPVAVRGAVYGLDQSNGDLVELRLSDGHEIGRVHVGGTTRFVTPAPVGRHVFVGTTSGVVAVVGRG